MPHHLCKSWTPRRSIHLDTAPHSREDFRQRGGPLEMDIVHHWTPIDNHLVMAHNAKHSAYTSIAAYILDQHCAAAVDIRLQSRTKYTGVSINAGESWLQVLHHTSSLLGDLLCCHTWVIHDDCCVSVKIK
jgi:hypothetical protein